MLYFYPGLAKIEMHVPAVSDLLTFLFWFSEFPDGCAVFLI